MKKKFGFISSTVAMLVTAFALTSCCGDRDACCDPCPRPCPPKPCCAKPLPKPCCPAPRPVCDAEPVCY
ncbi:MAG: hypothetical protein BGO10_05370 [Chlamydia sp. 32-24]|nr:MAG: hypothetical protein BGO10_05370 [Chlamydia sp. 32-24]